MTTAAATAPMGYPADQDFERWLAKQTWEALNCRIQGHKWPSYDVLHDHGRIGASDRRNKRGALTGGIMLDMVCERGCGVQRRAYLTGSYSPDRNANVYTYPENYQLPPGSWFDRSRRAKVRRQLRELAQGAA
jgi:hypothetical protein